MDASAQMDLFAERMTCRLCGEEFKVQASRSTMQWEAIQTAAEAVATDTNDDLVRA